MEKRRLYVTLCITVWTDRTDGSTLGPEHAFQSLVEGPDHN